LILCDRELEQVKANHKEYMGSFGAKDEKEGK